MSVYIFKNLSSEYNFIQQQRKNTVYHNYEKFACNMFRQLKAIVR